MKVQVRRARASDKAPLMSFIKDVWGGHDYIPQVWDDWLRDPKGSMFVVLADGVPVGMNRVQFLEDGSAWFEGVRVHPDFRGRGLATLLGENSMKVARERGASIFRLTSGSHNRVAHRQIARIRFEETARFSVYEPPGGWRRAHGSEAKRAGTGALGAVVEAMEASEEFKLGSGVFWHDYTAAALTQGVVRALLAEGAVWRLGASVAVTRPGAGGAWEQVCFVGGPPKEAARLVESLVGRCRSAQERWVFLPQGSPVISALRKRGFRRNFSMVLFQRRAAKG